MCSYETIYNEDMELVNIIDLYDNMEPKKGSIINCKYEDITCKDITYNSCCCTYDYHIIEHTYIPNLYDNVKPKKGSIINCK